MSEYRENSLSSPWLRELFHQVTQPLRGSMSAWSKKPFPVSISVDLDRPSSVTESEWPKSIASDDRQGGFPAAAAAAGEHLGVRTHPSLENRNSSTVNSFSM